MVPEAINYFLDSNVIIGYIFYQADDWGVPAKNVIENGDKKHYGVFVHEECFGIQWGKCDTIEKKINFEFRKAITNLKKNMSIDILVYDSEKWKIFRILQGMVQNHIGDLESLEQEIRTFQRNFETECYVRRSIIKKQVMYHIRRNPYKDLYSILSKVVPDLDDVEIILDAHDVGYHYSDLVLITGDTRHIFRNKITILPHVKIRDITRLKEFS